jgi:hypothetical protein
MNDSGSEVEPVEEPTGDGGEERRRRERRERVMARHPRIGWLLLALAGAQAYDERPRGGAGVKRSAREPDDRDRDDLGAA